MKRLTGVAFVLALALTSLAFAKGPPVPEGCVFERGTTTCTEIDRVEVKTTIATAFSAPICVVSDEALTNSELIETSGKITTTTTVRTYRGVSHVQKSDPVVTMEIITYTFRQVICDEDPT